MHFLLYTGPGSLVMVLVASAVVSVVVWRAVMLAVWVIALALWWLSRWSRRSSAPVHAR